MADRPSKPISRSKALQALRKRMVQRITHDEMWQTLLFSEEVHGNERAFALVLGAILEQTLETAILSHCIELSDIDQQRLFGPPEEAPVTFDVKIRISYALGVFGPDARDDMTCIRYIRNVFAHTKSSISFDSTEVIDICGHFKYLNKIGWGGLWGPKPESARNIFYQAVTYYFLYLRTPEFIKKPLRYVDHQFKDLYA